MAMLRADFESVYILRAGSAADHSTTQAAYTRIAQITHEHGGDAQQCLDAFTRENDACEPGDSTRGLWLEAIMWCEDALGISHDEEDEEDEEDEPSVASPRPVLEVNGAPVRVYPDPRYPAPLFERVQIEFLDTSNGYQSEADERAPMGWVNSAAIDLDFEHEEVDLCLSVGDPRGAFCWTLRQMSNGQIQLFYPHPEDSLLHMPLRRVTSGVFLVGHEVSQKEDVHEDGDEDGDEDGSNVPTFYVDGDKKYPGVQADEIEKVRVSFDGPRQVFSWFEYAQITLDRNDEDSITLSARVGAPGYRQLLTMGIRRGSDGNLRMFYPTPQEDYVRALREGCYLVGEVDTYTCAIAGCGRTGTEGEGDLDIYGDYYCSEHKSRICQ